MVRVIEAGIQIVIVGGVIGFKRTGSGQRAVQVHGAAHQNIRLGVGHLGLHTGHGIAAAQRDVLDLNAGVLLELIRDGDGVVLVQSGIDHQLAAGLGGGLLLGILASVRGRGLRFAAAASGQ